MVGASWTDIIDMNSPKVNKTLFSDSSLHDEPDDLKYWLSKTPEERLEAVESIRQVLYGYDETSSGLQRVFEVVERSPS